MKTLQIGDIVFFGSVRGYGGHGATCLVTKINRKGIKAVEKEGSYRPGQPWNFGTGTELRKYTFEPFTEKWFRLGDNGEIA